MLVVSKTGSASLNTLVAISIVCTVQAFVQKLEDLCDGNGSFLVPSLEAFATLCLRNELQVHCCTAAHAPVLMRAVRVHYMMRDQQHKDCLGSCIVK